MFFSHFISIFHEVFANLWLKSHSEFRVREHSLLTSYSTPPGRDVVVVFSTRSPNVLLRSWSSILSMFCMFQNIFCGFKTYSNKLHRSRHRKLKEILKKYLCVSDTKIPWTVWNCGPKSSTCRFDTFWTK